MPLFFLHRIIRCSGALKTLSFSVRFCKLRVKNSSSFGDVNKIVQRTCLSYILFMFLPLIPCSRTFIGIKNVSKYDFTISYFHGKR